MSYALVIGEENGRKSSAMREIADALAERGLRVGGFTQRISEDGPGRKAVELLRVRDATVLRLARTTADPGNAAAVCAFAFEAGAFDEARRWIEEDAPSADVLLLDGLGKLELGGGGHLSSMRCAPAHSSSCRCGTITSSTHWRCSRSRSRSPLSRPAKSPMPCIASSTRSPARSMLTTAAHRWAACPARRRPPRRRRRAVASTPP